MSPIWSVSDFRIKLRMYGFIGDYLTEEKHLGHMTRVREVTGQSARILIL